MIRTTLKNKVTKRIVGKVEVLPAVTKPVDTVAVKPTVRKRGK